ncbi:Porin B precursor [compost metagenome]
MPLQYNEVSSEIYYGFHVTNWLTVRPNLQYVKYPGGVREIDAAVIAGLKVQAKF